MNEIEARMQRLFEAENVCIGQMGWGPRLRHQFGHFTVPPLRGGG
jgi:hypothetical protein